jgi:hypothetical protein
MRDFNEGAESLSAEDAAFIERVAKGYAPPPLDPVRRAALDAALDERIGARGDGLFLKPVLASALVGLAVGFVWLLGALEPAMTRSERMRTAVAEWSSADEWERELLDLQSFDDARRPDDIEELPDDYAVIAGIFLDG